MHATELPTRRITKGFASHGNEARKHARAVLPHSRRTQGRRQFKMSTDPPKPQLRRRWGGGGIQPQDSLPAQCHSLPTQKAATRVIKVVWRGKSAAVPPVKGSTISPTASSNNSCTQPSARSVAAPMEVCSAPLAPRSGFSLGLGVHLPHSRPLLVGVGSGARRGARAQPRRRRASGRAAEDVARRWTAWGGSSPGLGTGSAGSRSRPTSASSR